MHIDDLPTPALVLDRTRLSANLASMTGRMQELGVDLRPHLKTAKSIEIARLATAGHSGGIAVSTLREAEYFAAAGLRDIVYAVGIVPAKLRRVTRLRSEGVDLVVILDSVAAARGVAAVATELGAEVPVLVEIDSDGRRAGVVPESEELIEVAHVLAASPATELRGVLTHAGASYECRSERELVAMAEQERAAATRAATRLRAAAFPCPVVSVGSTPTATFAAALDGVTEVRAGAYMFMDLFQAGLGVCSVSDIAVSVLATVIGHDRRRGRLITDAGALALSKDRSTASQPIDQRYGVVCRAADCAPWPELKVVEVNQEHGMVAHVDGGRIAFEALPIGDRLRVLPNHACMTAAAYDRYHVLGADGTVEETWERCGGW